MYTADRSVDGFVPRVRQTVTYIACTVLLNDRNEILMVQEAKLSCRGKWYLPAGRMERNETVEVCSVNLYLYTDPSSPVVNVCAAMIVWRIRGKIIRTVLCCIVYHSCTQSYAHSCEHSCRWTRLTGASLFVICLVFFVLSGRYLFVTANTISCLGNTVACHVQVERYSLLTHSLFVLTLWNCVWCRDRTRSKLLTHDPTWRSLTRWPDLVGLIGAVSLPTVPNYLYIIYSGTDFRRHTDPWPKPTSHIVDHETRDVPRRAGYPAIFSNPVPAPVPVKMVRGTRYLSRIVLGPFWQLVELSSPGANARVSAFKL